MEWEKINFTVEVGNETDIYEKIFIEGNTLYKLITRNTVEKITAKEFKEIVGLGIRAVKKEFKKGEYFIRLPKESKYYDKELIENDDYETDDYGIYLETDHMELIQMGCYNKDMNII